MSNDRDGDGFCTDAELARRWGVSEKTARLAIKAFEKHPRFPPRDPLMGNKRFWPAVQAFMRWRYGMDGPPPGPPDGEETFENDPARRRRRNVSNPAV